METLLLVVLVGAAVVQAGYWVLLFAKLRPTTPTAELTREHSIVVCYKNEAANLPTLLQHLSAQQSEEVILVDDFSTDGSYSLVEDYDSPKLKAVKATSDRPGKKAALYDGVKAAKQNTVVLTDADCTPASSHWSALMAAQLGQHSAVLGYAPMAKQSGIIPTFARYETWLTAVQYMSYALAGSPYMGVGRNMTISQAAAIPVLANMQSHQLASGDDDLLIQGITGTVGICTESRTYVYSDPPASYKSYMSQKGRHMTTSTHYRPLHQLLLGLFAASHMLTYLAAIGLLALTNVPSIIVVGILVTKWTVQQLINRRLMAILDEKDLWWKFPLLDIATFVYYMVMTPLLMMKNKSTWS